MEIKIHTRLRLTDIKRGNNIIPNLISALIATLHESVSQMWHSVSLSFRTKSAQKSVPREKFTRQPRSYFFVLLESVVRKSN